MQSLARPTHTQLRDFLLAHDHTPCNYDEIGATRSGPEYIPAGFSCGHQRIRLGSGRDCYLRAKEALREWKMFPTEFVDLIWPCPIEIGRVVATLFYAPGFWTVNPCRIVYTIDTADSRVNTHVHTDTDDPYELFGFAFGAVGGHLASGEERFLVEYHRADRSVWYEVYSFSKTNHWLSRVAYPYFRLQQHRFRLLSTQAMNRAVLLSEPSSTKTPVSG